MASVPSAMRPLTLMTVDMRFDAPVAHGLDHARDAASSANEALRGPAARARRSGCARVPPSDRVRVALPGAPSASPDRVLDSRRMRVLNSNQMREADRRTIEEIGIPVDRPDGKRRPAGGRGDGGELRGSRRAPRRRAVRARQQRRRRLRRRRTLIQRGIDVSVFVHRPRGRDPRRRTDQPRDSRPARAHGRRDRRRAGLGAAFLGDLATAT